MNKALQEILEGLYLLCYKEDYFLCSGTSNLSPVALTSLRAKDSG
jgi:hypothetical protein